MATLAHAKINLHLAVLARETTGFHQIETLFCALDLADEIDVSARGSGISVEVEGAQLGPPEQNLAYRAAAGFFEHARILPAARIEIVKRIPVAGGLGGGSSDAATTLLALNALHGYPLGAATVREIGFSLGSDVPFFLSGSPFALAWGRGERLLQLPAPPPTPVLLVVPAKGVATREAYEKLAEHRSRAEPAPPRVYSLDDIRSLEQIAATAHNDFESVIFARLPQLARIRDELADAGALHARLTGSGSVVFGLFRNTTALEAAAARIAERFPESHSIATATCERL